MKIRLVLVRNSTRIINPSGCFKGDKVRSSLEACIDKTNTTNEPEFTSTLYVSIKQKVWIIYHENFGLILKGK